jgi:hypothetical protein
MAQTLVAHCPVALSGACVLDFGAGTGATSEVIARRRRPREAVDVSLDMLRNGQLERPPGPLGWGCPASVPFPGAGTLTNVIVTAGQLAEQRNAMLSSNAERRSHHSGLCIEAEKWQPRDDGAACQR